MWLGSTVLYFYVGVVKDFKAFAEQEFTDFKLHLEEYGALGEDMLYERGHTQLVPKEGHVVFKK